MFNIFYLCVHIAFSPESAEAASRRKRVKRGVAKKKERLARSRKRGRWSRAHRRRRKRGVKWVVGGWVVEEEALIKMIRTRLRAQ